MKSEGKFEKFAVQWKENIFLRYNILKGLLLVFLVIRTFSFDQVSFLRGLKGCYPSFSREFDCAMADRHCHVKCTLSGPPYDYVVVGRDVDNHEC